MQDARELRIEDEEEEKLAVVESDRVGYPRAEVVLVQDHTPCDGAVM